MMETFWFDHITQTKMKYKSILNKMKSDFWDEIETLNEIIANMGIEAHLLIIDFKAKLKKANNIENELRERLRDFKTKYEQKWEYWDQLHSFKEKIESEKIALEGKIPMYK